MARAFPGPKDAESERVEGEEARCARARVRACVHIPVGFLSPEPDNPADLALLLLRAGDIETNPGPKKKTIKNRPTRNLLIGDSLVLRTRLGLDNIADAKIDALEVVCTMTSRLLGPASGLHIEQREPAQLRPAEEKKLKDQPFQGALELHTSPQLHILFKKGAELGVGFLSVPFFGCIVAAALLHCAL